MGSVPVSPFSKTITLQADLNVTQTPFVGLGFLSGSDPNGFWKNVQLWVSLWSKGKCVVMANGTKITLATVEAKEAFQAGQLNHLEISYHPEDNTVSVKLNGTSLVEKASLGEFKPTITDAGFRFQEQVGINTAIDNFSLREEGNAGGKATPPVAPPTTAAKPPEIPYPIESAHLSPPIWAASTIYGEAINFIKEEGASAADGRLLFVPLEIVSVHSTDGKTEYQQGQDYTVDASTHRLTLTPTSRIPFLERAALYKKKGEKQALSHKVGDETTYLLFGEGYFPQMQVEVDYKTTEPWTGFAPSFIGEKLPRTLAKLQKGEDLSIAFAGDSVGAGAGGSRAGNPPMPKYPVMFRLGLERVYGSKITLNNLSIGGTTAFNGLAKVATLAEKKADLVVIVYGPNDMAERNAQSYHDRIKGMIDSVRAVSPETEFILVSEGLTNAEWSWTPIEQFPKYHDALVSLESPGIVVADATAVWGEVLKQKRYQDLTANGVNHPNNFGQRLYAQILLAMLTDPAKAKPDIAAK